MLLDPAWLIYTVVGGASASFIFYLMRAIFEHHRQIGEIEKLNNQRYDEIKKVLERIEKDLVEMRTLEVKINRIEQSLDGLTDVLNKLEDRITGGV